jgi:hypothetical protein
LEKACKKNAACDAMAMENNVISISWDGKMSALFVVSCFEEKEERGWGKLKILCKVAKRTAPSSHSLLSGIGISEHRQNLGFVQ